MSKQDRQAVRTAAELERKLGGGKSPPSGSSASELQIQQLSQSLEQFMNKTNAEIGEIEDKLENIQPGGGSSGGGVDFEIYSAFKYAQITTAGIDTMTDGASIIVPPGTYIVTANAQFFTGTGTGTGDRNIQVRLNAGTETLAFQRIVAAAYNYGAMQVAAVYKAETETTLTVQKSSSVTENGEAGTSITALRFKESTASSGGEINYEKLAEYIKNKADLVNGKVPTEQLPDIPTKVSELINDLSFIQLKDLSGYAKVTDIPTVPTKVSAFTNDSGYLTEQKASSDYAKKDELPTVPTKVSAFENDAKYLTEHQSLEEYAKKTDIPIVPTKVSAFENDKGYLTEHQSLEGYAKKTDIPTIPTNVSAFDNDKGYLTGETDPTVPAWAKAEKKPVYTAGEVGADAEGTAANLTNEHNTQTDAHNDIRLLIKGLSDRLNAIANSDDTDLDDFKEVVAYIKANKSLIDSVANAKVSKEDIINDLATNVTDKPLSAAQGVVLKALIDAITVPTKVSQLQNDLSFLVLSDLSAYAKKTDIPTVPTKLSELQNDKKFLTESEVEVMLTAFAQEYLDGRKIRVLEIDDDRTDKFGDGYITILKEPMYEGEEW